MQKVGLNSYSDHRVGFSGIYSNASPERAREYYSAFEQSPEAHKLRECATRIFRELDSELGIARLIGYKPTDLHIIGGSDGSEVIAHAIAIKEAQGGRARPDVKIIGIDKKPSMVEIAKTGYIVCTDQEKVWANDSIRSHGNPLAGSGWDRYLKKQDAPPPNFDDLTSKHPELAQITRDPVSKISIGNGMHWYKVNTEGLPKMDFVQADMREYVKQKPSDKEQQVYVLANSLGYVAQKEGGKEFLKVFQGIQNQNNRKTVYVVTGDVEHQVFQQVPDLIKYVRILGFNPVSEQELASNGVHNTNKTFGKIWRLNPGIPINFV